jgi:serine/threonine protein phosphatase 1
MRDTFNRLFRPQPVKPLPAIPPGQRVYAIGDVHGRRDLFDALIAAIESDEIIRGPLETTIILLGDLIDRGPDSAGVIKAARALKRRRKLRILCGNHEELLLRCFKDTEVLRAFLRYGGRETVLSYPLDVKRWNAATLKEAQALLPEIIPPADLAFIRSFEEKITIGDYCFVHAGIDPWADLEKQKTNDLRWIREPFLSHRGDYSFVVVHGHTISDEPVIRSNRIGIDTGAYRSGRLTALALEGDARWLLTVSQVDGVMACKSWAA